MVTPRKRRITLTGYAYLTPPRGTWVSQEDAARAADIHKGTITKWKKAGKLALWKGKVNLDVVKELARSRGPKARQTILRGKEEIRDLYKLRGN